MFLVLDSLAWRLSVSPKSKRFGTMEFWQKKNYKIKLDDTILNLDFNKQFPNRAVMFGLISCNKWDEPWVDICRWKCRSAHIFSTLSWSFRLQTFWRTDFTHFGKKPIFDTKQRDDYDDVTWFILYLNNIEVFWSRT